MKLCVVCFSDSWILPRLARGLAERLPYAELRRPGEPSDKVGDINYYFNALAFHEKTQTHDIIFFDHPDSYIQGKRKSINECQRAGRAIAMTPQYQRMLWGHGIPCDFVVVPIDDHYQCKLVLGYVGRFAGATDYSWRKGKQLFDQVAALPYVDLRTTEGKVQAHELPEFYQSLDYCFVPSIIEGGPMSLFEAMACGKQVIIPEMVGCAELFGDDIISYPVDDFDALEKILRELYAKKKALADKVSRYTWDFWAEQHDRIFAKLMGDKPLVSVTPKQVMDYERAIVVVATPEVKEMTDITLPAIKAYAEKCKAKLIVWDDVPPKYQHPKYRLMALRDVKADRVLHLDADCFPLPNAPDIFEAHPPGYIYMWNEMDIRPDNSIEPFKKEITSQTGTAVDWQHGVWWNPGVMLCDHRDLDLFGMPPWPVTDEKHTWFGNGTVKNQPWINWRIAYTQKLCRPLDAKWNCITALTDSKPDEAYILHFGAERIPNAWQVKIDMAKKFSIKKDAKPRVLMATVVAGDTFTEIHKLIRPYHEAYAKKYGLDYRVIDAPDRDDWPSPSWWKLELHDVLEQNKYDVVYFIDGDAFSKPNAPNILSVAPEGKFTAFNSMSLPFMQDRDCEMMKSWRAWLKASGKKQYDPYAIGYHCNAGIWVCWREARCILECDKPIELDCYVEQHQVNWNLYNNPGLYEPLPRAYNFGHPHVPKNLERMMGDDVYTLHINGPMDKVAFVKSIMRWSCFNGGKKKDAVRMTRFHGP